MNPLIILRAASLCLVIALVSFCGYLVETIFVALTLGYIDNRNMMLPFLFGYGLGMAGIWGAFGTPTEPRFFGIRVRPAKMGLRVLYYAAVVFLFVSLGEALFGIFVEEVFHITWWDYSGIPLHVTKFTSVPTGLGFTALIMGFIHFAFERLLGLFSRMNRTLLSTLAVVLMVALCVDFIASGVQMYLTEDFVVYWRLTW